ncbi:MAG: flagellar biosynthetic protein FliO [Bdellovibrionaceae bacterium]|nr:flagellar biosynthetic protein FliO [Pseudobdellovibrionaceae bacterium]
MKLRMVFVWVLFLCGKNLFAQTVLQEVDTRFEGSTFVTELIFNQAPTTKNILIEYINQTIQVNLPDATVKSGKILKRVNQEKVKSVYSYQYEKDLLRTRIIYSPPIAALSYEGFVKVERKDNSLLINIYDPIMAKTAETKPAEFEIVPPVDLEKELNKQLGKKNMKGLSAEEIVAAELEIPKVLPEKVSLNIASTAPKEALSSKATDAKENTNEKLSDQDLPLFKSKEKIEKVEESNYARLLYSLLIVITLGVGLLVFSKRWAKNHKINDKNTKIKVLSQHHLGPKKSLVIIRIAGESHLLGVTDNNINMLKTLSFIDDEVEEDIPVNFESAMNTEDNKTEEKKNLPKITFASDMDLVSDLHKQISGKLKQLKDI